MRVPAMVRWTGSVPAGLITEEMLSAHDWFKTFAALAGASGKVPADRPLDGVDASAFLLGESDSTGRENVLFFGPDGSLMSSKWRNIKAILRYCDGVDQPILEPQFPMVFDLGSDPGEHYNLFDRKLDMGWMIGLTLGYVAEYRKSVAQYPVSSPARNSTATTPCPARRGIKNGMAKVTGNPRPARRSGGVLGAPRSISAGSPCCCSRVTGQDRGKHRQAGYPVNSAQRLSLSERARGRRSSRPRPG